MASWSWWFRCTILCDNVHILPSVDVHVDVAVIPAQGFATYHIQIQIQIDVSLLMKEISVMRYANIQVKDTCQGVVNECTNTMEKLQGLMFHLSDRVEAIVNSAVDRALKRQSELLKSVDTTFKQTAETLHSHPSDSDAGGIAPSIKHGGAQ